MKNENDITDENVYQTARDSILNLETFDLENPFDVFITNEDYIFTDMSYAKYFVLLNKDKIRYNDTQKVWYIWNGKHWEHDETTFHKILEQTNNGLFKYLENGTFKDKAHKENFKKFIKKYQSDNNIKGMLNCAKFESEVYTKESYYDSNPGLYNCNNGTIDLTGKEFRFREHRKDDHLTQIANTVNYNENADCPFFLAVLDTIFDGNQNLISYIQRALGYSLTGYTNEDCLFFLYGTGRNGKSTFTEIIKEVLGGYYKRINTETLLLKDSGNINNDIASLKGIRLVIGSEIERGRRLAESLVKDLTGGDDISARFLYKEFFSYKPQFKLWIYGNHKPEIRGTDLGIRRRIKLIPFTVTIPESKLLDRDEIMKQVRDELSGVLNWILQGFNQYKKFKLKEPDEVKDATSEYFDEMDILKNFIETDCIVLKSAEIELKELFQHYQDYCKYNNDVQLIKTSRQFAKLLRERGFKVKNNLQKKNKIYCFGLTKAVK